MKIKKSQLRRIIAEESARLAEAQQIKSGDYNQMAQLLNDALEGIHSGYQRKALGEEPGQTSLYRYTEMIERVMKALQKQDK